MTFDLPLARIARVAAAVALIACSTDSGRGNPDASESDAGSGDDSATDSGSNCLPECFRPINCRLSCSGPVLSSGCCPCMPPAFDDICCASNTCGPH